MLATKGEYLVRVTESSRKLKMFDAHGPTDPI